MTFFWILAIAFVVHSLWKYQQTGTPFPGMAFPPGNQDYLLKNFEFYRKLPPKSRKIFNRRVSYFMSTKKFIPRNMKRITPEMKLLISAAAIQITFGFPNVHLSYFKYILIYPDSYYSAISRQYHIGEVNPRAQAIVIAWNYFLDGYSRNDGRNLAIHEMAHALRLENRILNQEYQFLDEGALTTWEALAAREMEKVRSSATEGFFRKYAAENREEFFSVAVENFFDRPEKFFEYNERLYLALASLLKQDPRNLNYSA